MVSLAAQKFVTGIAVDALELQKQKRTAPQQKLKDQGYNIKDKRHVLSMVEIAEALQEVTRIAAAATRGLNVCSSLAIAAIYAAVRHRCQATHLL